MSNEQYTLRAILSRWQGGLQAQMLEFDIAVQGADEAEVLAEFAHSLTVSYEVAVAHGEAPFAGIGVPPKAIREQWRPCTDANRHKRSIALPEPVAVALATALRKRKPIRLVEFEDAVAA